ncbi:MAG: amino acid permease [Firmicutes bacterium]|nr:amino acid permease [Bacillota bacterium]
MVIGSGIFFKPGVVLRDTGSAGMSILAWTLGGIITLAAGLTMAELAAALPLTGGLYSYLEVTYGRLWGGLFGWVQTAISFPGSVAALAIIFATQLSLFIPMTPGIQTLVAIAVIFLLVGGYSLGSEQGGAIQVAFTLAKLVPILLITVLGLWQGSHGLQLTKPVIVSTGGQGLAAAILATLWAYDGWIAVTNVAGEIREPQRNLPRAIIGGLGVVLIVYVCINLAMLKVLPPEQLAASATPASEVAQVLFGQRGATVVAVGIALSIVGALNGYILTGARVPFAMAKQGNLPWSEYFSQLHRRYKTPVRSLLLIGLLATFYVFSGSFNFLTDLAIFTLWTFFIMRLLAVIIMRRRRPDLPRPYKVPLYPITPLVAIIGGLYILVSTLIYSPTNSLLSIAITLLGIPVYKTLKR